jgi:hypothetical protein
MVTVKGTKLLELILLIIYPCLSAPHPSKRIMYICTCRLQSFRANDDVDTVVASCVPTTARSRRLLRAAGEIARPPATHKRSPTAHALARSVQTYNRHDPPTACIPVLVPVGAPCIADMQGSSDRCCRCALPTDLTSDRTTSRWMCPGASGRRPLDGA